MQKNPVEESFRMENYNGKIGWKSKMEIPHVSVFDADGKKIGTTPEQALRDEDVYRMALVFMINPKGEVLLSKSHLQNKWTGRYEVSVHAPVRENEQPVAAASRALQAVGIKNTTLKALPEKLYEINNLKRFLTFFVCNTDKPLNNLLVREWKKLTEVNRLLQEKQEQFSPFFYLAWKQCRRYL